jgi:hypothetical protein
VRLDVDGDAVRKQDGKARRTPDWPATDHKSRGPLVLDAVVVGWSSFLGGVACFGFCFSASAFPSIFRRPKLKIFQWLAGPALELTPLGVVLMAVRSFYVRLASGYSFRLSRRHRRANTIQAVCMRA